MPGPFPGMDPYLEHPAWFPAIHQSLITFLWLELNARLPSNYVANIGERLLVTDIGDRERIIYPDVLIVQNPLGERGGTALAEAPPVMSDEPYRFTYLSDNRREVFIEIVPVADESTVIALIEVLSPANKTHGTRGHEAYVSKQQQILDTDTHLVEIDLLRGGLHSVAVEQEVVLSRGDFDYCVCLHRGATGEVFDVWARTVRQRLPRFVVPLRPEDSDIAVDLQALFDHCYDAGNFARRIQYQNEPSLPLRPEDAEWADALLREKGLRK